MHLLGLETFLGESCGQSSGGSLWPRRMPNIPRTASVGADFCYRSASCRASSEASSPDLVTVWLSSWHCFGSASCKTWRSLGVWSKWWHGWLLHLSLQKQLAWRIQNCCWLTEIGKKPRVCVGPQIQDGYLRHMVFLLYCQAAFTQQKLKMGAEWSGCDWRHPITWPFYGGNQHQRSLVAMKPSTCLEKSFVTESSTI